MKIALRGGHSVNCIGSVGLRDEYSQMQTLYKYVRDILIKYGHKVIDCNSNLGYMSELKEGVTKANSSSADIFISLHMNASNGQGNGAEAWVYSNRGLSGEVATRLVNNYSNLGFKNRGVKEDKTRLYELKNTLMPSIIFETCFCDSEKDINIWSPTDWDVLALNICNAIDPNIPLVKQENEEQKKEQKYKFATTKNVTTSLNIRSEANANSNILASIPTGGGFYIMWTEIGWHYIKFYDLEGYVNADYVKILD